ncbi:DSS1/SEM1 family-domain-containing protein [Podospora australis]|uniref:26S proteasome complex subunit SEM1 n=1 Tax=Podospora australis TaxID=1536484 RepID=A0AAN6WVE8_9PEZI|nr:DSS1/SEM1 family-domain-containing protein [Podospora australis]
MASSSKDTKPTEGAKAEQQQTPETTTQQKPAALEEDDEFEDFPVDDWAVEDTEATANTTTSGQQHLWEESWDDDDTSDDFSNQLKEELKKVEASKKR